MATALSEGICKQRPSGSERHLSARKKAFGKDFRKRMSTSMNNIAKYLYEVGQLKRVKRSGWWMAGITDPESVAEHSFRTALLGYILASLEGADPQKTAMICLFHDLGETRINDLHRVAKRYIDVGDREEAAFQEQAERLPHPIAEQVVAFMHDY